MQSSEVILYMSGNATYQDLAAWSDNKFRVADRSPDSFLSLCTFVLPDGGRPEGDEGACLALSKSQDV
jgi:hypothetical protein